jgi:hypothetical protein
MDEGIGVSELKFSHSKSVTYSTNNIGSFLV